MRRGGSHVGFPGVHCQCHPEGETASPSFGFLTCQTGITAPTASLGSSGFNDLIPTGQWLVHSWYSQVLVAVITPKTETYRTEGQAP